jgi:predicted nucleic-acid-binding Zn-ribbon protein/peroxiredoxin
MTAMPGPVPQEFPPAADVELPDTHGQPVRLSALWAAGPLALAVLPPFGTEMCGDNAAQLRDNDDAFAEAGGTLAAIVTASPEGASAFAREWNLAYRLLSDTAGVAHTVFGIAADPEGRTLPASFIIDTSGRITHEHRAASHYGYAPAWELVDEISELTGKVVERPELPLNFAASTASLSRPLGGVRADAPVSVRNGAWSCARCGVQQCEMNDVATASGLLSRIFNLQNRRFVAVTCMGCGYTELYKRDSTAIMNIIDFLSNG